MSTKTRSYRYITSSTSPNQSARNGSVTGITIHWWGKPTGQSAAGIVSWLCDKRAKVSAHYVVSEGTVWCIVDPDRKAWHAGSNDGNNHTIGLELDPNASRREATMRTAAALIADLRATYGDVKLYPHRHWTSTECPGDYDLVELDKLARGGTAASKPASTVTPTAAPPFPLPRRAGAMYYYGPADGPVTSVSGRSLNTKVPADVVKVGGRWRSNGLAKWQQRMRDRGYSLAADGRYGDETAAAARNLQRLAGLKRDALIGPDTWAAAWTLPVQ